MNKEHHPKDGSAVSKHINATKDQFEWVGTPETCSTASSLMHSSSTSSVCCSLDDDVSSVSSPPTQSEPSSQFIFQPPPAKLWNDIEERLGDTEEAVKTIFCGESRRKISLRGASVYHQPVPTKVEEILVAEENITAFVCEDATRSWPLRGAGVYNLRIARVSGLTAHCEGTVTVLKQGTGEVLWELSPWRSDRNGVDVSFSIPIDEKCIICLTMQAHHFSSGCLGAGRSVAWVRVAQTASFIKGRFRRQEGSSIDGSSMSLAASLKSLSFGHSQCHNESSTTDESSTIDKVKGRVRRSNRPYWDDDGFDPSLCEQFVGMIANAANRRRTA